MHIVRKAQRRKSGEKVPYLLLRHAYRDKSGTNREQVMYLCPELSDDRASKAKRALRRRGFTAAEIREILLAVEARAERNEHQPSTVQRGQRHQV